MTDRERQKRALDAVFSKYIRLRDADDSGYAKCITCNATKFWNEGDAGHFISRAATATRWDERNVHFQCKRCNIMLGGRQFEYALALDAKYGIGTAEGLYEGSKRVVRYSAADLKEMKTIYQGRVERLLEQKSLG